MMIIRIKAGSNDTEYTLPAQFVAHLKPDLDVVRGSTHRDPDIARMSPIDSIAMEEPSNVICRS